MNRIGVIAVVVALGLGVVACSDDTKDESGELSKSQFAAEANQACTESYQQADDALKNVNAGVPTGAASAQALNDVAVLDRLLVRQVDGLVNPQSEEDQVDQLLDHWRDRAKLEQKISQSVTAGADAATLEQMNDQLNQIDDKANAIARKLDLDQCERGGT